MTNHHSFGHSVERDANACAICQEPVRYPDGVHLRNGKEVHVACVRARRERVTK